MTRICVNKACGQEWWSLRMKGNRCPACHGHLRKFKPGINNPTPKSRTNFAPSNSRSHGSNSAFAKN